jgi:hypothetical protein
MAYALKVSNKPANIFLRIESALCKPGEGINPAACKEKEYIM